MKNMTTNKKLLSLTALTAVLGASFVGVQDANAQAVDVQATAKFLETITLTSTADMDFSTIEVTGALNDGANLITMRTDGSISYAGNTSGIGTGTAGLVTIDGGADSETVEVYCSTSVKLSEGNDNSTIELNSIGFDIDTGTTTKGGTDCAGTGTGAGAFGLDTGGGGGGPADEILLGGIIDGGVTTGTVSKTTYSTSDGTADPIKVDVQYQ